MNKLFDDLKDVTSKCINMNTPNEELEEDCKFSELEDLCNAFNISDEDLKEDTTIKSINKHSELFKQLLKWYGWKDTTKDFAFKMLQSNELYACESEDYIYFIAGKGVGYDNAMILGFYDYLDVSIEDYFENYFTKSKVSDSDRMKKQEKRYYLFLAKIVKQFILR